MKKQLWRSVSIPRRKAQVFLCLFIILFSAIPFLQAQDPLNLACVSSINVTLDDQCSSPITPAMILTGETVSGTAITVLTVDQLETDTINGCGTHTFNLDVIEDEALVFSCWGTIIAEDKTPPQLNCPEGTSEATLADDMQNFFGIVDESDPVFSPASFSCYSEASPPIENGPRNYEVHHFNVSTSDIFTFISTAEFDGIIALYQNEFNPNSPCQNLIARSDQTYQGNIDEFLPIIPSIDPSFRVSLPLQYGTNYTLVITTRPSAASGDYNIAVFADDDSRILNLSKTQVLLAAELVCLDVDEVFLATHYEYSLHANGDLVLDYNDPYRIPQEIRHLLDYTGHPDVYDNCSQMLVTVYDELEEAGDCGDWTITRHFEIRDRYLSPCEGDPLLSECIQIITVRKPSLADVVFPPISTVIECDEGYPTDGDTGGPDDNPSPSLTGYPYLSTAFNFYDLNQSICNIGASYSDEPRIEECPGTYYFRREWTFIDWCDLGSAVVFNQLIKVGDFTGPILELDIPDYNDDGEPDQAYRYSTSPASCQANLSIPVPDIIDGNGCADIAEQSVRVTDQFGQELIHTTPGEVISLNIGTYQLNYCATDECDNTSCRSVGLEVYDAIEPTAICNDEITVSLGGGDLSNPGTATLSAEDIDEGSSDHCGNISLTLKRDDGEWLSEIQFNCEDIGDTITVTLQVTDETDNSNICWLEVIPEDKLLPYCYAPEAYEVSCTDWPLVFAGDIAAAYEEDFDATSEMMSAVFGHAEGTDNCAVDAVVEREPTINLNECGWGTITRRFEAWQWRPEGDANDNGIMDASEVWRSTNTCSQLITISEQHDFIIDFPEDASADCTEPNVPTIITEAEGCDVLSVNIGEPIHFEATGDECYKLSITYDVINWCLWDGEYEGYIIERMTEDDGEAQTIDRAVEGNERPIVTYTTADGLCIDRRHNDRDGDSSLDNCASPELENYGRYIYTQFVKVYDSTAPVMEVGEYGGPTEECPDLNAGQFGDWNGSCDAAVEIPFSVNDECELFDGTGELVVSIISAELDAFAVDTNGDGAIKANEFVTDEDVLDNILDNSDGTYTFSGTFPIITSAMGPNVVHAIRILLEDGCGNQVSEYIDFDVVDCKGPAPVCINGLTVTLMPSSEGGCEAAIWASDFEGSPIYDCTGQGPETDPTSGNLRVNKYAIYRASTVEAAGDGFVPDPAQTGIVLTDLDDIETAVYVYAFDEEGNYDYCETYVLVQYHENCIPGASLAGIIQTPEGTGVPNVSVSISGNMQQTAMTNLDGQYSLQNLIINSDISIIPHLDSDPLNGVTTFDLVLIAKHILGVQPLDNPYKMIAADANGSGFVSTLDMIIIRKLILTLQDSFTSNDSWLFIPEGYIFPNPSNPWEEEFTEFININNLTGEESINFKAIKVGDVNDSASF